MTLLPPMARCRTPSSRTHQSWAHPFGPHCLAIDASRDPIASRRFDELVDVAELRVEPVTHDQARIARDAYRDFGKGSGHKAGLNFGDCFAYALAKSTGEALLFKGNGFSHTDITPALPAAAG